jgi:hypothetical protein
MALRPELVEQLVSLAPSESTPLLLKMSREQAARRRPADLLAQLEHDRFVHPSFVDQRLVHQLDGLALEAAAQFEALLLSPVAPLGACSVVAKTSQDRTMSTTRGTEVVSDPTNVLALLCAQRLKRDPAQHPKLCTVHETLRAQALPPRPGFSRHFRLFALAEAGRAQAEDGFEVDAIARHVGVFDRLMDGCAVLGASFPQRALVVLATPARKIMAERVRARLAERYAHIEIRSEGFDHPYYDGLRVMFGAHTAAGEHVPICDTGVFDWMPKLTANARHRFVASGCGIQLIPALFRPV